MVIAFAASLAAIPASDAATQPSFKLSPQRHAGSVVQVNGRRIVVPMFAEVCSYTGLTLSRYCREFAVANPELSELTSILNSVQSACKQIASISRGAPLTALTHGRGLLDRGAASRPLDMVADSVLRNALKFTGKVSIIAGTEGTGIEALTNDDIYSSFRGEAKADESASQSGEADSADEVDEVDGGFVAVLSPLDAPANAAAGMPSGTIFGIFDEGTEECMVDFGDEEDEDGNGGLSFEELSLASQAGLLQGLTPADARRAATCMAKAMRPGSSLITAGYCCYGSSTMMVLTLGAGAHAFTLDASSGEFVLTHPDITLPLRGAAVSAGPGVAKGVMTPVADLLARAQKRPGAFSSSSGSIVADFHRVLLQGGGLVAAPADDAHPDGHLKLLSEAAPLAFIAEQAGGAALTGLYPIMDVTPGALAQRVPAFFGSAEDVLDVKEAYEAAARVDPKVKLNCAKRLEGPPTTAPQWLNSVSD